MYISEDAYDNNSKKSKINTKPKSQIFKQFLKEHCVNVNIELTEWLDSWRFLYRGTG